MIHDLALLRGLTSSPPGSPLLSLRTETVTALLDVVEAALEVPWDVVADSRQDRVQNDAQAMRVRDTEARLSRLRAALASFAQ